MYDITNEDSFIAVRSWINSIQEHIDAMPQSMILVGNKVDLDLAGKRQVLIETGETFAKVIILHYPL
jgi:GTPase SAR1 family protein